MNKFDLINTALISELSAENKALLIELIMRSDESGYSWPSVERLCKARGIRHEKNFKGADVYLPGLVTKTKNRRNARKNAYTLNVPAILALEPGRVTIKHTPAPAVNDPGPEGANRPALADESPAEEGANSSTNNTHDDTEDNTEVRFAHSSPLNFEKKDSSTIVGNKLGDRADRTERARAARAGAFDHGSEW